MSITKILNDQEMANEDKLTAVAEVVAGTEFEYL